MYVLERSVLDLIAPGENVSIEREVFPRLVGEGLHGLLLDGYWMDIGTPERYLQASWDILEGGVDDPGASRPSPGTLIDPGAWVGAGATVGPRAVVGPGCRVEAGAAGAAARSCSTAARSARAPAWSTRSSPRGRGRSPEPSLKVSWRPKAKESPPEPMLDDVLAIPDHLRDALWRVESARLAQSESAGLLVCGMGGSAVGGDLAAAALGDRLSGPLLSVRGYGLPSWATAEWTVLCSSYSGETEETLACFAAAEALGARQVIASHRRRPGRVGPRRRGPGDRSARPAPAPRTAVAYMFVCAAEVAAAAGVAPRLAAEIEAAAAFLEAHRDDLRHRAAEVAAAIGERVPVVYGAGPTAAAARRWKTQVNENAKQPAFGSELPEADHNEICIWEAPAATRAGGGPARGPRPAPARAAALRADRGGGGVRRRGGDPHRGRRREPRPSACSGR